MDEKEEDKEKLIEDKPRMTFAINPLLACITLRLLVDNCSQDEIQDAMKEAVNVFESSYDDMEISDAISSFREFIEDLCFSYEPFDQLICEEGYGARVRERA